MLFDVLRALREDSHYNGQMKSDRVVLEGLVYIAFRLRLHLELLFIRETQLIERILFEYPALLREAYTLTAASPDTTVEMISKNLWRQVRQTDWCSQATCSKEFRHSVSP